MNEETTNKFIIDQINKRKTKIINQTQERQQEISNNYRMSSLQCAYGISEMRYFRSHPKAVGFTSSIRTSDATDSHMPLRNM